MLLPQGKWPLLLVDDEADIRDVLTIALSDFGYRVITAQNGREAIARFQETNPPIVLTDIKMPGMDGIELLRAIKHENPEAEVVMLTGHGDMDLAVKSIKHQATDFLIKPINVDGLRIALDRVREKILIKQKLNEYTASLEALVREKIELQDRLSSLGLMIGSISHGIKGLMTNLDAGLYMLDSGFAKPDEARCKDGLEILKSTTDHIKKLMLDILFYSKDRELQVAEVALAAFLEEVADSIRTKLTNGNIELVDDVGQIPATFNMDPDLMRTALINIFDNAVDACRADIAKPSHRITFRAEKKDDHLVMEIKDTGIGMDTRTREKIFDLFYSSKGSKGTGFGLFITRNIVFQHNGTISVTSTKGRGTVFRLEIPPARGTPPS